MRNDNQTGLAQKYISCKIAKNAKKNCLIIYLAGVFSVPAFGFHKLIMKTGIDILQLKKGLNILLFLKIMYLCCP